MTCVRRRVEGRLATLTLCGGKKREVEVKLGTIEHPKTTKLMGFLGIPRNHAVGILEHLWHYAGRYSPDGAIGKFSDEQIRQDVAPEIKRGLLEALVDAGWVDVAPEPFRLIVHDWKDHADQRVRKWMERNDLEWAEDGARRVEEETKGTTKTQGKTGQCPDGVRTSSGQCPDGVRPRARATEPEPEPEPEPCGDATSFPDTFAAWLAAFQSVPGPSGERPYEKTNRGEAERWWLEVGPVLKNVAGAREAVAGAWAEFVGKSNEAPYPRQVGVWRKFARSALERLNAGGESVPRGTGSAPTGAREASSLPTDVDLDEGDAAARKKQREDGRK